eukprot:4043848-Prymnesium_polylepis.1
MAVASGFDVGGPMPPTGRCGFHRGEAAPLPAVNTRDGQEQGTRVSRYTFDEAWYDDQTLGQPWSD